MDKEDLIDYFCNQIQALKEIEESLEEISINGIKDDILDGVCVDFEGDEEKYSLSTSYALDRSIDEQASKLDGVKDDIRGQIDEICNNIIDMFFEDMRLMTTNPEDSLGIIYWYDKTLEIEREERYWEHIIENTKPSDTIEVFERRYGLERKYGNRAYKDSLMEGLRKQFKKDYKKTISWIDYLIENNKTLHTSKMFELLYEKIATQYALTGNMEFKSICKKIENIAHPDYITYSNMHLSLLFSDNEEQTISQLNRLLELGDYKKYLLPNDKVKKQMAVEISRVKDTGHKIEDNFKYLNSNLCHEIIILSLRRVSKDPEFLSYYEKFVLKNNIKNSIKNKSPRIF